MDLSDFHIEVINPTEIVPAPAQGVLAVQINEHNEELKQILSKINQPEVAEMIGVERKVLNLFEGGCHMPLGCYCRFENGQFEVWTSKAATGDDFPDRVFMTSETTEGLAERIVASFAPDRVLPQTAFITRDISDNSYLYRALQKHNIQLEVNR